MSSTITSTPLEQLMATDRGAVDPSAYPNEVFELFSIPAYDGRTPEVLPGSHIGSAKKTVQPGDVLLSRIVPHIRRAWVVPQCNGKRQIASGEWIIFRGSQFHPSYLRHFLMSDVFHVQFMNTVAGVGGSLLRARPAFVGKIEIPLPPLREQKRIAAILDKADAIRRKRQGVVEELRILPRVIFQEMFGNTTQNDRDWPLVRIAEAGEVQLGRQRSPKYQTGTHTRPYVRVANVFEDRIDLSDVLSMDFNDSDFRKYELQREDILLNEGQSTELVGRPAIWQEELPNCCFQNTLVRFRAFRGVTDPEFALGVFLDFLRRGAFARVSSKTSSVAHLGAARFAEMPFPLPPLTVQQEYAKVRKELRDIATRYCTVARKTSDLFNSLVQRAFRGVL